VIEPAAAATAPAYSALAEEYYDVERHPTCAAFRAGSARLLGELVPDVEAAGGVEIGAGDSLLARTLQDRGRSLDGLLVTDDSPEMLEHSRWSESGGAELVVAPCHALPVDDGSAMVLVASLADPYDDERLWAEARRVLAPGAVGVVTAPSWEWSSRFRREADDDPDVAVFVLADGRRVEVPSLVRSPERETKLIEAAGLRVVERRSVTRAQLAPVAAPKLGVLGENEPVVVAYVVAAAGS
jgi:SAM-dependent methyltransferase